MYRRHPTQICKLFFLHSISPELCPTSSRNLSLLIPSPLLNKPAIFCRDLCPCCEVQNVSPHRRPDRRPHLISFPSLKDHSPMLPIVQCLNYFGQFSSCFKMKGTSGSCYYIMARSESQHTYFKILF